MSDNGATLTVDRQGNVFYGPVRLPVRYKAGALEFVVKDKRLWSTCGKRATVPLDDFKQLERVRVNSIAEKQNS